MDKDEFAAFVRSKAEENFNAYGNLTPVIVALQDRGLTVVPLSRLTKEQTARLLQRLRTAAPLLAMVSEAWMVNVGNTPTPEQQEKMKTVRPSKHPDRKEAAMVTIYHGMSMTVHTADIIRSGRKKPVLGPWKTFDAAAHNEGRFSEPPPDWN